MYAHICKCRYTHTDHTHTHTHARTHIHIHTHTHTHSLSQTHTHTRTQSHTVFRGNLFRNVFLAGKHATASAGEPRSAQCMSLGRCCENNFRSWSLVKTIQWRFEKRTCLVFSFLSSSGRLLQHRDAWQARKCSLRALADVTAELSSTLASQELNALN